MKILVTGGAGFIGSNIAEELVRQNHEVIVLDDLFLGSEENLKAIKDKITFVKGCVTNKTLVNKLVRGCSYIFHEAALSSAPMFKKDPRVGYHINVCGFKNIMHAAVKHKVKRVMYASTSSMYSGQPMPFSESQNVKPNTFYEASFLAREMIARAYFKEYGLLSMGLRYFSVYGPNERAKGRYANIISQFLWDMIQNKSPVIYGDGTQTRDYTYVKDIVDANIAAMTADIKENEVINVGTGIRASFNDLINILNRELKKNIKPTYVDNPLSNYVVHTLADISKAKAVLGYSPKYTLEQGIRELIKLHK